MTDTTMLGAAPSETPDESPQPGKARRRRSRNRVRQPRRRFPIRVLAVLVAVAVAVVVAGWLLSWQSPVPIREVEVSGAQPESHAEILSAAGIEVGTPIRELDTEAVVARVDQLPGIDGASVVLSRPWTIVVDVVERFPFALVANGQQWTVVDSSGQEIRVVPNRPEHLPELAAAPDRWSAALTALGALDDEVRGRVKSVTVADNGAITLELRSDATVEWGTADRSADKARVLAALLRYNAATYNLTEPDRPAMTGELELPKENRIPPSEEPLG